MSWRFVGGTLLVGLVSLAAAPAAFAHKDGKAEPRISAAASGAGTTRLLRVRLVDIDDRTPVRAARVVATAEMTSPHTMRTAPWVLAERTNGTYLRRVRFPMAADWTVRIEVTGAKVVPASAQLRVRIVRSRAEAPGSGQLEALPTRLSDDITSRDLQSMLALWLHGLAAMAWIVGVVVMAIALSTRPGVLAEGLRQRFRESYLAWGAWLHWGLVPMIVVTGIYNMRVVRPFPLIWRPSELEQLADIPYGALYEAILLVKLGLFAALLVTGTQVLVRTLRTTRVEGSPDRHEAGFMRTLVGALGPPGVAYVAIVPLILGAAMALRYVHVLSHVGEVIARS